MKWFSALLLASALLRPSAHADHGQEFFLLYDAKVRAPGHGSFQSTFSFLDEGDDDTLSLSPGFTLGVLPRTALSVRADFADEASSAWAYRAIEPGMQIDLTPRNFKLPIRFGISASYQFVEAGEADAPAVRSVAGHDLAHASTAAPASAASSGLAAAHDHSSHSHSPEPSPASGVDLGPDALTPEELAAMDAGSAASAAPAPAAAAPAAAAPAPAKPAPVHDHAEAGHSHAEGIHNHEDNLFTARLAFEVDLSRDTLLIGNLISVLPEGGSAAWGYAVGLRQRFLPQLAAGFEALGDFSVEGHHEVLGALYWEPIHHLILKAGVGAGLTSASPDGSVRAGLVWIF